MLKSQSMYAYYEKISQGGAQNCLAIPLVGIDTYM